MASRPLTLELQLDELSIRKSDLVSHNSAHPEAARGSGFLHCANGASLGRSSLGCSAMPGIGGGPEVSELLIDDEVLSPCPLAVDELEVGVSVPGQALASSSANHHPGSSALHGSRSL